MFVDEVNIKVIAGNGGDGCTAFRREKYVAMGGPFGGDGGRGSSIIFKTDEGLRTLIDLKYNKIIKGDKGQNGLGKNCHGKSAKDIIVKVPVGTVVTNADTGLLICDLNKKDQEVVVATGGRGGRGNTSFRTKANPCPNFSEKGEPGEVRFLKIELRLLADVGLVGLPSVGKSTIISKISNSKPKIADYHFTTLNPNLGVVKTIDNRSFVVADLPGLIKGASLGEGLGDKFLKHIKRTRVIVHVIDMSKFEYDPYESYQTILKELNDFDPNILKKKSIILANKMDTKDASNNLKEFKSKLKDDIKIFEISAIKGEGLEQAMLYIADILDNEVLIEDDEVSEEHVLYKYTKEEDFIITKEDDMFVITSDKIEKLFRMTKFTTDEAVMRFAKKLTRMGVDKKLEEMGAIQGDKVRILDYIFEYRN